MRHTTLACLLTSSCLAMGIARPAHALSGPIGTGPGDIPKLSDLVQMSGNVKLKPSKADMSWCGALTVTIHVQELVSSIYCPSGPLTCQPVEAVGNEYDVDADAIAVTIDGHHWRYQSTFSLNGPAQVELSAHCDPAWDYRYKTRAIVGTPAHPLRIAPGDKRKASFRVKLVVPPPETRTVVLRPVGTYTSEVHSDIGPLASDCDPSPTVESGKVEVGYLRDDYDPDALFRCQVEFVTQGLLWFDLSDIQKIPHKLMLDAQLSVKEKVLNRADEDGNDLPIAPGDTCIGGIGTATADWVDGWSSGLVPNDALADGRGPWMILAQVTQWLVYPDTNEGVVIKSIDESFTRNGAICRSRVLDPKLTLKFVQTADVPVLF